MALSDAYAAAVGAWNLDEASGDRADQVGSSTLTDLNTVGSAAGKFGNAADFEADTSEALICAGDNAALSMGDVDFTLRCWVKLESKGATRGILAKWNASSSNREYALIYNTSNDRYEFYVSSNGTAIANVTANNHGSPSTGTWYLIHAWHDSVNNQIGISVNAGTANTASYSSGVFDGASSFSIGYYVGGTQLYMDGLIDDAVVLKNYVMSSAERTADYNGGTGVAFANWATSGNKTLSAASGSFTLTGQAATPKAARKLSASAGSFTETGQAATLRSARRLTASAGDFALAGQDATLAKTKRLAADAGAFTVSGQDASLQAARVLPANAGDFEVTGQDATFAITQRLAADSGAFSLSGQDAALTVTRKLSADAGSFTETGQAASLLFGHKLPASDGAFSLSGQAASLIGTRLLSATAGAYVLTGQAATLVHGTETTGVAINHPPVNGPDTRKRTLVGCDAAYQPLVGPDTIYQPLQ